MRRLETKEEQEKGQKRRSRMFGMFMLLIMVLSTVGYAFVTFQENRSSTNSADSQLQEQDANSRWILDYQGQKLSLSSSKESVKNISVASFLTINNYIGNPVYIDYGNNSAVLYELSLNLGNYADRVIPACYGKCELNLPEKNCTDYLIVYNQSNKNRVYQQENCVFIEGDIRAADAFIYTTFKVY